MEERTNRPERVASVDRLAFGLVVALGSNDAGRRKRAADRLWQLGPRAVRRAVGPLLALLDDDDREVRIAAGLSLFSAAPLPDEYVPALMRLLLNRRPEVRGWSASLLGDFATARVVVARTLETLAHHDPSAEVRWRATTALAALADRSERPS
jgi:hypothetical protein